MVKCEFDQDELENAVHRMAILNVQMMESINDMFEVQLALTKTILGDEEYARIKAEIDEQIEAELEDELYA